MKAAMNIHVSLMSLLLVLGSFSSVSGFYPRNPFHPVDEIGQVIEGILGIEARERWIELVVGIGLPNLPPSATIFFPTRKDIHELWIMEPQIIRYHIVPRAISYWQLSKHSAADNLLPTLLPYMSINVTGDTICNIITVDNVPITHPEMFNDGFITVHGVSSLLIEHYLEYLGPKMPSSPPQTPQTQPHKHGGPKMPSPPPHTQPHKHGRPKMPSPPPPPQTQPHKHGRPKMPSPPAQTQPHKHGRPKMPSHTQPHNQHKSEDQTRTFPFEMPTGPIPASGGTSIKRVSIALLMGVWAVLLS